jgi:hypothetical protein
MFYYVLDASRLTCVSSKKASTPKAVAAADSEGKAGNMGFKH